MIANVRWGRSRERELHDTSSCFTLASNDASLMLHLTVSNC